MYNVGDQVVHKVHGAGVVSAVEEKTIDGMVMQFVRVRLTLKEGDILLPLRDGVSVDLRKAITQDGIKDLEEILSGKKEVIYSKDDSIDISPKDLIASNDPYQIAQAIRILTNQNRDRGDDVDVESKEILSSARMKLASELMEVKSISKAGALSFINRSVHGTEKFLKAAKKLQKKRARSKSQG